MTEIRTNIDGVTRTTLRQIVDSRGAVLHMLRADAPDFLGFGECYFSEIQPQAVKAWKRHQLQSQTIAVPVGRILLAIFDDRTSSPTIGQVLTIELGRPDDYYRIRIPPGLWYGFACLGSIPALLVNCADYPHQVNESEVRSFDDSMVPYQWSTGHRVAQTPNT
jgi:dTDP-4-dehydrorhamnose 3,5-epimerase